MFFFNLWNAPLDGGRKEAWRRDRMWDGWRGGDYCDLLMEMFCCMMVSCIQLMSTGTSGHISLKCVCVYVKFTYFKHPSCHTGLIQFSKKPYNDLGRGGRIITTLLIKRSAGEEDLGDQFDWHIKMMTVSLNKLILP